MADPKPPGAGPMRVELTVPCEARFRRLLEVMCRKMAAHVGYPEADAGALAGTVAQATAGVFAAGEPRAEASLHVRFTTTERELEIRVRCLCAPDAPRNAAPRDAAGHVEHGQDGGIECCTLTRPLPGRTR